MRSLCPVPSVALWIAGCVAAPADEPSTSTAGAAIVGGELDLEHTAVFDILVEGEQSCTGTLISPHLVLTAAHCIVEDVDDATELVVFTGPDQLDLAGGELHAVVAGLIHPTYLTDPIEDQVGDMALLILAELSTIQPMRYNQQPLLDHMIGTPVHMVGYGDTTVEAPTSGGGRRRQATSPLVDFDENWVAAGTPTSTQCYGDSGGPVLMELDGIEQVIGINSWQENDDCNEVNYNTRVDRLSQWIDEHVRTIDPGFDVGGDGGGDEGGDGGGDEGGGGGDGDGSDVGGDTGDDGELTGDDESGGGCQMTDAPRGGSIALFLALGVMLALAHRRRPVAVRSENDDYAGMVGRSSAMLRVFELIERIAPSEATVLINGETGTGKELVAEAIHQRSRRAGGPFVVLDCGAIPHHLIEDQLFGHERGAFTGATFGRAGVFERGDGGTLFLDEIGELPLDAQTKLLRAIETRVVRRIGSSDTIQCDVRLLAATNRDLASETNRGRFRSDLYYRVAVARIEVPPLRDRLEDLELLAGCFVDELTSGQQTSGLPDDFMARARRHAWPGNVRELRNAVQRALTAPALLDIGEGPASSLWSIDTSVPFKMAKQRFVDEFDRRFMTSLLEQHGWNISAAARATGLGRMSIYKLLERLGLARNPSDDTGHIY